MESHEYAKIFPMATDEELREMADDIKKRGLLNAIITLDGKVLDGRNRLKACEIAEIAPRFQKYIGVDPLGDVVSWNLKRRQMSTSQRAEVARTLKPMFADQARERQRGGQGGKLLVAILPEAKPTTARDQAADAVGVSGRTVQDAEYVHAHAPELSEKIKAGQITVNAAKKEVKRREEEKSTPAMTIKEAINLPPCIGLKFARLAIMDLEQIRSNDKERKQAFALVKEWIHDHETET